MSRESEDLWRYVHGIVNERVPPEHREAVTDLVAQTTVHILTTPEFLYGIKLVRDLQAENEGLRRAVVSLQMLQARPVRSPARKTPAKKRAPAKKAAPRKAAAKKKSPAARAVPAKNTRAFKRGAKGR